MRRGFFFNSSLMHGNFLSVDKEKGQHRMLQVWRNIVHVLSGANCSCDIHFGQWGLNVPVIVD